MSAHTKGPWFVASEPGSPPEIISAGLAGICTMSGASSKESVMADARLIAAAPELLEALREAADYTRHPDYDWPVEFSRRVSAAIAKATGSAQ